MRPGVEISERLDCFGYVYMWCDTKRNKYYIGSHKGSTHDTYKSGSSWVNTIIKKRPDTMIFRVLDYYYGYCREELYTLENKWLLFYNVENNKAFYNFKNTARGGVGPFKHKGKKRAEYTPGWVDHRKGKTAEEIYKDPELFRKRISEQTEKYYKTHGHYPKLGKKHNTDSRRGKTVEQIYGYRKIANPNKPFVITIMEPYKPVSEILCNHESDFFQLLKMESNALSELKKYGKKQIKRIQTSTKHKFSVGTILELKFVNDET